MKQKIKEALKTRWSSQLGIKDEKVFEGVATSVEPLITNDEQLTQFVEGAKDILTQPQSYADKVRTELNAKIKGLEGEKADLEAKLNGNQPPEPKSQDTPDIAALIEAALDKKLNPITERLNNFETAQSQKSAVAALDELKATWDYAQGFPEESEYAYNMAMGIYNGIGKTWTAEQLTAKYKETFNERVSKKGVDTTKPFQSDGGAGTSEAEKNAAFAAEIRNALGMTVE